MSKAKTKDSNAPAAQGSYSTGNRGDSALNRNKSGNHHGNRQSANKTPSNGK
jgi:hypothetical protein